MSNATATAITPEQAAEMFKLATTSASKWAFLDGVSDMVTARAPMTQKDVVDLIGDTSTFQAMHGDHRDSTGGGKARSKLKSIRDEVSVVKVWPVADRVDGVSFEAHKVLNRLGSSAGHKILTTLVGEMGGPGNVTKAAVAARLKVADPDHKPQANGKAPAATGNQPVTVTVAQMSALDLAQALGGKLTVGDLAKDTALAAAVEKVVDIFEAFANRKAAKAAATAPKKPTTSKPTASSKRPSKPSVKTPTAPKRPSVKAPVVKAPAAKK